MRMLRFCLTLVLVAAAAVEGAVAPSAQRAETKNFDLGEVLDGSFSARGLGAVWVQDNRLARWDTTTGIEICSAETANECQVLVNTTTLNQGGRLQSPGSWSLSQDLRFLLWSYEVSTGYRHSTEARYSIYNTNKTVWVDIGERQFLRTAQLSPDGRAVAFVNRSNNIYYVKNVEDYNVVQITQDGSDVIYNGIPDWVYEEEVLSSGSALWFSKDGSRLAYGRFDDTLVANFSYITYGYAQYTKVETLKYPKPGTPNPTVKLGIVDLNNITDNQLLDSPDRRPILQYVSWTSAQLLNVGWFSRIQNEMSSLIYHQDSSKNWQNTLAFSDEETAGWLDVGDPWAVNDTTWVQLLPRKNGSNAERYQRVAVIVEGNFSINADRTTDGMVATAIYGWNPTTGRIFFQAAPAGKPGERHVYSTNDFGSTLDIKCLTCNMTQYTENEICLYASAVFSLDLTKAAITCSGPHPAVVRLANVLESGSLTWGFTWQDNKNLRDKLSAYRMPVAQSGITVEVPGGINSQVKLWLPPGVDRSGSTKYPMLVYVYGGPGSQQVSESFSVNWGTHLTTSKEIIYAAIDGRGSGYQGSKTLYALYKKLGTVEVEDQINVTSSLLRRFPFIDPERVGIWGWSYGGYASAMALARDNGTVFKCGASVAPVTSWDLYNTIYTERFMGELKDNVQGYKDANISNKIEEFKDHEFFLLHGNADDNVHYQQAMRLVRALQEENILFNQQSYPDENHSIRPLINHVYGSMDRFFDDCFKSSAATMLPSVLFMLVLAISMRFLS